MYARVTQSPRIIIAEGDLNYFPVLITMLLNSAFCPLIAGDG
jgi:hypothetical protein